MLRILTFTIHKHPLLGGSTFELTNPDENETSNYFSIIIGPNGTGKSILLNHIIEAFNEITILKVDPKYKPKKKFTVIYLLNGDKYCISTENLKLKINKNDFDVSLDDIVLPPKWIASSVTINDKYPILNYIRSQQIPQYKYLGIRSATNNAFLSRIMFNTVINFIEALQKNKSDKLLSVYNTLGLNSKIEVIFSNGPMLKLEKKDGLYSLYKNINKLIEPHQNFIKKNKSKTNYRSDTYKKHIENKSALQSILYFMEKQSDSFLKSTKQNISINYKVDLESVNEINNLLDDWSVITIMLDLELIKIKRFLIRKQNSFQYEEASSGESHLLTSLHGIIANLEDNSLLIIDEPEVSLHPNWQIDYFDLLKSIVDNYKGVNTIISTHSHLLVSSLKNEESRITSLSRDVESGIINIDELDYETYGWDPESILYNVFEVATLRNKYFELDLSKLISLISTKNDNKEEIRRLKDKVGKYILSNEDDPLKLLIKQVDEYLNK